MPSHPPEAAPPAEAQLIRRAREARGLSPEEAAKRLLMSMTGRRWRQLEKGIDSGTGKATAMSDPVLAHMAYAVGVSADQLVGIGKDEASAILQEILRQQAAAPDPAEVAAEIPPYVNLDDLEPWERQIWQRVTLLADEEKELGIEFIKGIRRRAARSAEDAGQERSAHRRTG